MEDFEIIQAVRRGDREAYAELVRRYEARVRGLCVSLLLNTAEADDAAQDVFLKVFTSLKTYRQDASFSAWIYRIASNHCLDVLRKRKRRKTESLDELTDQTDEGTGRDEPRAAEIEDPGSVRNDERALAFRVLSYLPAEQRELLMLREVEGLRYDEIAVVLKCSVEAVRARLHRARRLLHEKSRHFSIPDASTK
jgi:RNA polymerase sigma-70 factor (ECF subfamily)